MKTIIELWPKVSGQALSSQRITALQGALISQSLTVSRGRRNRENDINIANIAGSEVCVLDGLSGVRRDRCDKQTTATNEKATTSIVEIPSIDKHIESFKQSNIPA